MAEYIFDNQVNVGWGLTLAMTGKAPAIANRIFKTYDDAVEFINSNTTEIPGINIAVFADPDKSKRGAYHVKLNDETNSLYLSKLSEGDLDISSKMIDIVEDGGKFYDDTDDPTHTTPITDPAVTEAGKYLKMTIGPDVVYLNTKDFVDLTDYYKKSEVDQKFADYDASVQSEFDERDASIEGKLSDMATRAWVEDQGYATQEDVSLIIEGMTDVVKDPNYVHTDNNFDNEAKSKLDGIEEGAEANVQSDWNETDESKASFIKNKPEIPTKVSDLDNDSNFVSEEEAGRMDASVLQEAKKYADENFVKAGDSSLVTEQEMDDYVANATRDMATQTWVGDQGFVTMDEVKADAEIVKDGNYVHTDNNFDNEAKSKLEGIEEGAQENVIETIRVVHKGQEDASVLIDAKEVTIDLSEYLKMSELPTDLVVKHGELIEKDGVKYLRLTLSNDEVIDIKVSDLCDVYVGDNTTIEVNGNVISVKNGVFAAADHDHDGVYVPMDGYVPFSQEEKDKLEGIKDGAEANVQADWNQTNDASADFIKNKPNIATKISDLDNDLDLVSRAEAEQMDASIFEETKEWVNEQHFVTAGDSSFVTEQEMEDYVEEEAKLGKDVTAAKEVGYVKKGQTLPTDLTFQGLVELVFDPELGVIPVDPTLTLKTTGLPDTYVAEVGSTIVVKLAYTRTSGVFDAVDGWGGPQPSYCNLGAPVYYKDGVVLDSSVDNCVLKATPTQYIAKMEYGASTNRPVTNKGNKVMDDSGYIPAGTATSNSLNFKGGYMTFSGDLTTCPADMTSTELYNAMRKTTYTINATSLPDQTFSNYLVIGVLATKTVTLRDAFDTAYVEPDGIVDAYLGIDRTVAYKVYYWNANGNKSTYKKIKIS